MFYNTQKMTKGLYGKNKTEVNKKSRQVNWKHVVAMLLAIKMYLIPYVLSPDRVLSLQ